MRYRLKQKETGTKVTVFYRIDDSQVDKCDWCGDGSDPAIDVYRRSVEHHIADDPSTVAFDLTHAQEEPRLMLRLCYEDYSKWVSTLTSDDRMFIQNKKHTGWWYVGPTEPS